MPIDTTESREYMGRDDGCLRDLERDHHEEEQERADVHHDVDEELVEKWNTRDK